MKVRGARDRVLRATEVEARGLEEARARSARETAEVQAAAALAAARARGLEEGHRLGLAAGRAEAAAAGERLLAEREGQVVTLALEIAERLVGDWARQHPEPVRHAAAEALRPVRRALSASLRVHPEDREALADLGLPLIDDPSVDRGGVVVDSELGRVDGRLEVRLEALRRALEGGST